jgi:hypothetical protein
MKTTTNPIPLRGGIWPIPVSFQKETVSYKLEVCQGTHEARLRIYKGSVKTSAYLLIPKGGVMPANIPVADWHKAQAFYQFEDEKEF